MKRHEVILLLLAAIHGASAFEDLRSEYELTNYDPYLTEPEEGNEANDLHSSAFRCAMHTIHDTINGCTRLSITADDTYDSNFNDWRVRCSRSTNEWNRNPTNLQRANAFNRNLGSNTFGCEILFCDLEADPVGYSLAGASNGRSAVIPDGFYCGRPSQGMTGAVGSGNGADITFQPSDDLALLELGVERIFGYKFYNSAEVDGFCGLKIDETAVCWGGRTGNTVTGVNLTNVKDIGSTRRTFAFLKNDGTVEVGGSTNNAYGGDLTTVQADADAGNTVVVRGNKFGTFVGIREDGTVYSWGFDDGDDHLAATNIVDALGSNRAFLLIEADGTITTVGSAQFGATAPPSGILDKNITKYLSSLYGFSALAFDGHAECWGNSAGGNSVNEGLTTELLSGVVDIAMYDRGCIFLKDNGDAYSVGVVDNLTPIPNVSSIWGGEINQAFAVIKTDGTVESYDSAGLDTTISDGTTYVSCASSFTNIVCVNTLGEVKVAYGSISPNFASLGLTANVTQLYGAGNFFTALKENTGELVAFGGYTMSNAEREDMSADVIHVVNGYNSFGYVRGEAVQETSFPTVSPTASPIPPTAPTTGAPSITPTTSAPTSTPTGTPTDSPTTASPSGTPTTSPSAAPSVSPTTGTPSTSPSGTPTDTPTSAPTSAPSSAPSASPTEAPVDSTSAPTDSPSAGPTVAPTDSPVLPQCGCPAV